MSINGIEWVTFDCYGTLVDWEAAFGAFLYSIALRSGDDDPPRGDLLRQRWEEIQFETIQGPYTPYKTALGRSLKTWCEERGYSWVDGYAEAMVMTMRSIQPFHETRPALERARDAGLKLAIISNTDWDIISHTLKQLAVPFDEVVVAEDCGAYKPSPVVFEKAIARIGASPDRMLHVAFGYKYDIGPAQQFGMRSAWVNRNAEPLPDETIRPDFTWPDLWGLAAFAGRSYDV